MEHCAYRIVQEALTNTLKHADASTVAVRVNYDGDQGVRLEVRDDGRTPRDRAPMPSGGLGLVGLAERAALYGGYVDAGPAPGGGWHLIAHLPHRDAGMVEV
jgi:signal transduction histidine kinase